MHQSLQDMLGCEVLKFSQPHKASQTRGIADLRVYHTKGKWWHEVKAPNGKQSNYQRGFQLLVERHGETYILGGVDVAVAQLNRVGVAKLDTIVSQNGTMAA